MFLLYHAYVYLEFLILACTIYILAPTRNIWNGTVTGSVSGLIRLELTQVRLSMQYLPPAGLNNNPTEAAWDY